MTAEIYNFNMDDHTPEKYAALQRQFEDRNRMSRMDNMLGIGRQVCRLATALLCAWAISRYEQPRLSH